MLILVLFFTVLFVMIFIMMFFFVNYRSIWNIINPKFTVFKR